MVRKWLLATVGAVCLAIAGGSAFAKGKGQDQGGQVTPYYGVSGGPVDPFYGSINPFYGGIYPFYGQISPFWGDITPFWGTINPFYGSIDPFYGNIDPFWGTINPFSNGSLLPQVYPFWNSMGPQWGNINTLWGQLQASGATDYSPLQTQLNSFLNTAISLWGSQAQQYAAQAFAKYEIDPSNPASLAATSAEARSAFFLNFYDATMNLTGLDHVDWWMSAVHWSPQLVQTQGTGVSLAGLLDASITRNYSDVKDLKFLGGYKGYVNDHGAAVASLLAAQQDGTGVMGVEPKSVVRLYNPFDASGTASWADVTQGIFQLYGAKASVINASLGLPGWTLSSEWGTILTDSSLNDKKHYFVLVKAAGNEATVQTSDIAWPNGFGAPSNLVVVGSVGPTGQISSFSNTPGEACILVAGSCQEQNKLKYRFLVAPGELILVEDNQGGTTRMTGTSFAAPLVSGAIAMMQTRWPWLKTYADETVQILLRSATDLGAPGVDPVYGSGMLNIEATQSPLDFNSDAVFKPFVFNGKDITVVKNSPDWTPADLKSAILTPGQLDRWQQQHAFLVAFENIGNTYRDFLIPLSSALIGKSQKVNGLTHPFESYLYKRLLDWAQHGPSGRKHRGPSHR